MIESDAWFRLRWFLIGSLVSLVTVFVVAPKRAPLAAELAKPVITVVPTVVPAQPSAAQKSEATTKDAPIPRPPNSKRVAIPTAPAAKVAAPAPKVASSPAVIAEPPKVDELSSVRTALAKLRAKPRDGQRRSKLERAIEVAAASLGAGRRAAIQRCVIQAGFEGRAGVAAEHLGACVAQLEKAIP